MGGAAVFVYAHQVSTHVTAFQRVYTGWTQLYTSAHTYTPSSKWENKPAGALMPGIQACIHTQTGSILEGFVFVSFFAKKFSTFQLCLCLLASQVKYAHSLLLHICTLQCVLYISVSI